MRLVASSISFYRRIIMAYVEKTCPICGNYYPIPEIYMSQLKEYKLGYCDIQCKYCKCDIRVDYSLLPNGEVKILTQVGSI